MPSKKVASLGVHHTYEGLERAFRERVDPFHFQGSSYEQKRFEIMLGLARRVPHARILEIGCAEGDFTRRLLTISEDVTAIDLSADAIARAERRAPGAHCLTAKIEDLPADGQRYDLIVCAEMLYYLDDPAAIVPKLRQLGAYLLTSNCYPSAFVIDRKLTSCRLLQRRLHLSVRELKGASICLWRL